MVTPLALGLILAAATGPAHPSKFDLLCRGKRTTFIVGKVNGVEETEAHLRIDLDQMLWCGNECQRKYPIEGAVTNSEIVLNDSDRTQSAEQSKTLESHAKIDRSTGVFTSSNFVISYGQRSGGWSEQTCEAAPFSGMPAAKF